MQEFENKRFKQLEERWKSPIYCFSVKDKPSGVLGLRKRIEIDYDISALQEGRGLDIYKILETNKDSLACSVLGPNKVNSVDGLVRVIVRIDTANLSNLLTILHREGDKKLNSDQLNTNWQHRVFIEEIAKSLQLPIGASDKRAAINY